MYQNKQKKYLYTKTSVTLKSEILKEGTGRNWISVHQENYAQPENRIQPG